VTSKSEPQGSASGELVYQWTSRDRWRYTVSLLPFLAAFAGTADLLGRFSIKLTLVYLGLYLLANFFQAGACTGCPYRGRYCPPIFGVYFGNLLSVVLYRKKEFDRGCIQSQAKIAEVLVYITLLFPLYWLFRLAWLLPLFYLGLLLLHLVLFMPTQCEKCSYSEICPGGAFWHTCRDKLNPPRHDGGNL